MDGLNVFYRAFLEYRKKTATDKNIRKLCDALQNAPTDSDALEMTRTQCKIDEDWILIIEEGLEHVEKAIREERQFIRKEGEVVPIEKLKRVSTETVRHLAKHSNLITREPEPGEDIMPEKLYMAENLSDFAVYENRFLYMLLCYTRDFIGVRLDKILELGTTCHVMLTTEKHARTGKKSIQYTSSLQYVDKNDNLADKTASSLIERIETAQRLTVALLMTPLMKEVSKAPMLTPPITRTNVLRMNVHFKAALEMYSQLVAYTKDGYSIEKKKNQYRPFPDLLNADIAELIALKTFTAYRYGNQLTEQLKIDYEQEERAEKQRRAQELEQRLLAMKRDLAEKKVTPEEYILLLEERCKLLEKDGVELKSTREKVERLSGQILEQQNNINHLKDNIQSLQETITAKEGELRAQQRQHESEKKELAHAHDAALKEKDVQCQALIAEVQAEKNRAVQGAARIDQRRLLVEAQLHGLRQRYGLIPPEEDYTSKEFFMELEREFDAFEEFLQTQWRSTKKRIRKEILGNKRDE